MMSRIPSCGLACLLLFLSVINGSWAQQQQPQQPQQQVVVPASNNSNANNNNNNNNTINVGSGASGSGAGNAGVGASGVVIPQLSAAELYEGWIWKNGNSNTNSNGTQLDPQRRLFDVLVDVRTASEFAAGHIENATLLENLASYQAQGQNQGNSNSNNNNKTEVAQMQSQTATPDALRGCEACTIAVYCRSGARAAVAAQVLYAAGYTNVYNAMGTQQWTAAGYPLVSAQAVSTPAPCMLYAQNLLATGVAAADIQPYCTRSTTTVSNNGNNGNPVVVAATPAPTLSWNWNSVTSGNSTPAAAPTTGAPVPPTMTATNGNEPGNGIFNNTGNTTNAATGGTDDVNLTAGDTTVVSSSPEGMGDGGGGGGGKGGDNSGKGSAAGRRTTATSMTVVLTIVTVAVSSGMMMMWG